MKANDDTGDGRQRHRADCEPRLWHSRRDVLTLAGVLGTSVLGGCLGGGTDDTSADATDGTTPTAETAGGTTPTPDPTAGADSEMGGAATTPAVQGAEPTAVENTDWRSVELSPVRREESITVADFEKPVVLEAFAVWCPVCTRQQERLADLDDSVVTVSIDVDPNENAERVRTHAEDEGFDWRYAVAPPAMVDSLVDAFGRTVTNPPSAPVVVACPDGDATLLAGSVSSAAEIEATADNC